MEVPDLRRRLSLFPASNIVIADMIGAGIFTTSGLLLAELHDPRLLLALWLVGGLLALMGALCYGVLGAAMPQAGGEYRYLSDLYHPLPGFLSGWISFFVGFSAPLAASSLGFAEYAARTAPAAFGWAPTDVSIRVVAILVIVVLSFVHTRGLESGSRVQNYLTVGKVALILVLVFVGFLLGDGSVSHFRPESSSSAPVSWKTIGLSLIWIMFGYSGWNASGYIGSEIKDPERNLPRSLLLGTSIVILLYLALNALFIYAVPAAELEGVVAIGGLAASKLFSISADRLISALVAFALLSSISALIILGPRVYYAMAKDGLFFKRVKWLHPRFGVPTWSIWIQCAIAVAMVATGTFDQILTYMGFCLGIFPLLAVLGVFRLSSREQGRVVPVWTKTAALVFSVVSLSILVLSFFERPMESTIGIATVLAGIPLFFWFKRQK